MLLNYNALYMYWDRPQLTLGRFCHRTNKYFWNIYQYMKY